MTKDTGKTILTGTYKAVQVIGRGTVLITESNSGYEIGDTVIHEGEKYLITAIENQRPAMDSIPRGKNLGLVVRKLNQK